MKKVLAAVILLTLNAVASAQQIPYLPELFSRYETFNRLYNEKRRAGADLSAIEPLRLKGEESFKRGSIPGILETLGEAIARLKGLPWDEKQRFSASLTLETDRLVIEPNQTLSVALVRMFPTNVEKAFPAAPVVTLEIRSDKLDFQPVALAAGLAVAETSTNASRRLLLPDGKYSLVATITVSGQKVAEVVKPLYAIGNFSDTLTQMSATIATIKNSTDPKVKAVAALVSTPEFQLQRLAPLNKMRGEDEINPIEELDRIEAYLTALSKGENPFLKERGEVERAYRAADGKLVPYRMYVPKSYDDSTARPLVLLLHGALGDERYYFSGLFDPEVIKGEAERRGVILAGVNGRGRLSGYQGPGLEDSFEVINAVTRDYKIDPARIYVTGHSMGGLGTWLMAAHRPEMFAAIAPVSSGAPGTADAFAPLLEKIKDIPVLVVHGGKDGIVTPARSRDAVAAAKKAGLRVEYLEAPEADHMTVLASTFGAILDFFEKSPKPAPAK
ncbi:MAG TPA: prolyl oligopeptidase family serine peptidase [Blastocatellia bacterium]|nr:prolyl oligopeptidase family serine peptidase [Blastocatellia bacterium]